LSARFERRAVRDLRKLGPSNQRTIVAAIMDYANGTTSSDVKKLQGRSPPEYRLRVGRFRVIFANEGGTIVVLRVADRKDAY